MELNSNGRNITYDMMNHHAKRSFCYKKGGEWVRVNLSIDLSDNDRCIRVSINENVPRPLIGTIDAYPQPDKGIVNAIDAWGRRLIGMICSSLEIKESDIREATNLYDLL